MSKVNSRTKGNTNERRLAALFATWTKRTFARVPSSGGLSWKTANAKGDIICTDEKMYFPFCIEAKNYKEINFEHLLYSKNPKILEFWAQCTRDAKIANKIPILTMRYNGMPKDLHFMVIEKSLYYWVISNFINYTPNHIEFNTPELDEGLIILTSDLFFSLPYKRLSLPFKNYLKNYYEIIKPWPINKDYKISNRGYFINKKGFKITGTCNSDDVKITVLPIGEYGGKRKTVTIYKEVAKIFVKNLDPLNKKYVNHIKPSRFLTDARGLEWVTPGDNLKHYYDNKKTYYIIQKVDAKTQEILGEFNTPILAAKSIGKDSGSTIVKCIKGKRKTAYGFIWKEIANPHFKL